MKSRRWLWLLATGALLILLVAAIAALEPYKELKDTGPSLEARINPWLAGERFLEQHGISITRTADVRGAVERTPAPGHTLLLLAAHTRLEEPARDALLDWVARGGHLVMIGRNHWDEESASNDDWLLDQLGLRRIRQPWTHSTDQQQRKSDEKPPAAPLTRLYLENEPAPALLAFSPHYSLEDPQGRAAAWAGDDQGQHLLQLGWGQGLITVLSDDRLWRNSQIGEHDHAWLLWYLTQDSEVLLVSRLEVPDLLDLLERHYPLTLLAGALLLALGLLHLGRRSGPLMADVVIPPRSLTEHLRVAAGFLARHAGHAHLLRRLQQDIRRQATHHYPGYERLPAPEQWQLLAEHSGLPRNEVREALRPPGLQSLNAERFTHLVIRLQRLRNSL